MATGRKLLVVGGNGFLGSAICKTAVGKGYTVSSVSSSGTPYRTPAGHTPAWANQVTWHKGDAFTPSTYSDLVAASGAVVHTLGILLEDTGYKGHLRDGNVLGVLGSVARGLMGDGAGRLRSEKERRRGYEGMNRDSALAVLDTMLHTPPTLGPSSSLDSSNGAGPSRRPFVYISAADAFRPLIPRGYLESKRQAEVAIAQRCREAQPPSVRPIFVRPGLMYHPHIRPISTFPAFGLSLTAAAHDALPLSLPFSRQSMLGGVAEALRTHPLHVDHVAEAVLRCVEDGEREGTVEVDEMREWAGFGKGARGGQRHSAAPQSQPQTQTQT